MHAVGPSDADLLTVAKLAAAAGAKVSEDREPVVILGGS